MWLKQSQEKNNTTTLKMALSEKIFFLRRLCLTSEKRVANMETEGKKRLIIVASVPGRY